MRTHGHREGSTKYWGLLGGKGEGQWEGEVGRDNMGRNAGIVCTYSTTLHDLHMYPRT